jgi:hypothetical protein
MVGITLSPEQIHQAPPEVRRWIEQQIGEALGLSRTAPTVEAPPKHLVGCHLEQVRAILPMISGLLPVVGVFFELAHEPIAVSPQGLHVLRLDDMQRYCRLQGPSQVIACLGAIDEALQRLSGAPDVALTVLDGSGHCLVAGVTAQSILALWQEIVSGRDTVRPREATAAGPAGVVPGVASQSLQAPYGTSISPSSVGGPQQADAAA